MNQKFNGKASNQDPQGLRKIWILPLPREKSEVSVEEALRIRRSIRQYPTEPLNIDEISQLCWAAQGVSNPRGNYRTAPSAGALYPLETYLSVGNVTDMAPGIYKYLPQSHELVLIQDGDHRGELVQAALGQTSVQYAPAALILAGNYDITTAKYRERGIRYVFMEAGHAAQNVTLQAVALNLATVVIGAFHDQQVKEITQLPERETPLYIIPLARR